LAHGGVWYQNFFHAGYQARRLENTSGTISLGKWRARMIAVTKSSFESPRKASPCVR
jgi:hypothetical protein